MNEIKKRPGRKIAAEKRRIARETMKSFIGSDAFYQLDRKVQVAILQLCPSVKEPVFEDVIDIRSYVSFKEYAHAL